MSRDVLVAMDRSDSSADALEYALEEYPAASVYVVHVTETNDPLGLFGVREPAEYMVADCDSEFDGAVVPDGNSFNRHQRQRAQRVLERACRLSDERGCDIEPIVHSGDTVEEILACAEEKDVDHIVIAEHRRTAFRPILRSGPECVVRRANRPVTVVG